MSLVTVGKNGTVYRRKFDHEEARRRYAKGESGVALAREYGVSDTAVYRVLNDTLRAKMDARVAANIRSKREPCLGGCGRLVWRHGARRFISGYCPTCHGAMRTQTVRPATLLCSRCGEWQSDDAFPSQSKNKSRRGRSHECRACQTISRRERHHANPEAEAAYQRSYKRRIRAKA